MTTYYTIKNKATGLWDICTDRSRNPPLDKNRWATDFKTEEEAKTYLTDTLKKIKEGEQPISKETIKIYKKAIYKDAGKKYVIYGIGMIVIGAVLSLLFILFTSIIVFAGGAILVGFYYLFRGIHYYIKSVATR